MIPRKCFVGLHKWGQWYATYLGDMRLCVNCAKEQRR